VDPVPYVVRLQVVGAAAARVRAFAVAQQQPPEVPCGHDAVGGAEIAKVAFGVVHGGTDPAAAWQTLDHPIRQTGTDRMRPTRPRSRSAE
jgi:hypothetical protein